MKFVSVCLFVVGVIHIVPLKGVLGATWLSELYGVTDLTGDVELLLRHRAVLFGFVGAFLVYCSISSAYQYAALAVGLISTLSFILLASTIGVHNGLIDKVVLVDWAAVILLSLALVFKLYFNFIE